MRTENYDNATTQNIYFIIANSLTTGSGIYLASDSADSSTRSLGVFSVDNAAATGSNPIKTLNNALVSTNFKKAALFNGVQIWTSDGTTPNGNLSGTTGDICLNGDSGKPYYCVATTSWTAFV
jgi:hypothetical protein